MIKKHYVHAEHCPQGCQACIDIEWEEHEEEERQMWDDCSIEREEEKRELQRHLGQLPPVCKLCEGFGCGFCPSEDRPYPPHDPDGDQICQICLREQAEEI